MKPKKKKRKAELGILRFLRIEVKCRHLSGGDETWLDREVRLPDDFEEEYVERIQWRLNEFIRIIERLPLIGGRYDFSLTVAERPVEKEDSQYSWYRNGDKELKASSCWSIGSADKIMIAADDLSDQVIHRLLLSIQGRDVQDMQHAISMFMSFLISSGWQWKGFLRGAEE